MVGTILPIVYGERKRGKFPITLFVHAVGYSVGGFLLGGVLGALATVLRSIGKGQTDVLQLWIPVGFCCFICGCRELGLTRLERLPISFSRRQVPHRWRFLPPTCMALLYGLELGFAITTNIPISTIWVVAVWVLFNGSPLKGAFLMSLLGVARILPLVWVSGRLKSHHDCFGFMQILPVWRPLVRVLNGTALVFAGAFFLTSVPGS